MTTSKLGEFVARSTVLAYMLFVPIRRQLKEGELIDGFLLIEACHAATLAVDLRNTLDKEIGFVL
jgi:hypothetical protein